MKNNRFLFFTFAFGMVFGCNIYCMESQDISNTGLKRITLISSDGNTFTVPERVARVSETLNNLFSDAINKCEPIQISLSTPVLQKAITYMNLMNEGDFEQVYMQLQENSPVLSAACRYFELKKPLWLNEFRNGKLTTAYGSTLQKLLSSVNTHAYDKSSRQEIRNNLSGILSDKCIDTRLLTDWSNIAYNIVTGSQPSITLSVDKKTILDRISHEKSLFVTSPITDHVAIVKDCSPDKIYLYKIDGTALKLVNDDLGYDLFFERDQLPALFQVRIQHIEFMRNEELLCIIYNTGDTIITDLNGKLLAKENGSGLRSGNEYSMQINDEMVSVLLQEDCPLPGNKIVKILDGKVLACVGSVSDQPVLFANDSIVGLLEKFQNYLYAMPFDVRIVLSFNLFRSIEQFDLDWVIREYLPKIKTILIDMHNTFGPAITKKFVERLHSPLISNLLN